MKRMKRCRSCGKYTLKPDCCGQQATTAHPPKYSPQDKYAAYRRREKYGEMEQSRVEK
ncbi:MAG: nucleolar RNA-binding Nop10p family protein [Candidatus Burarchaeum sp.]|nr:nucleolar RNA-binding Nop10p family protein [Candidatus Burarchaeum sp.]MDO8339853.1 nucleolar RNA-binding Nop10p family protein [Candidatus Burarchaeum sp.]